MDIGTDIWITDLGLFPAGLGQGLWCGQSNMCVCNLAKSVCVLLNVLRAQVSREGLVLSHSSRTAAPNTRLLQEAERETIFCANILLEKENPWCTQLSSAFIFTSKPCRAASFHPVPRGSQQTSSKENFCSNSIPKRREGAGQPQHQHLAAGAASLQVL